MKKLIALAFALVCVMNIVGCVDNTLDNIDKTAEIIIIRFDISNGEEIDRIIVADEESIKHICNNLNSLKLKKLKYNDPTVLEYELIFYDSNGEKIEAVYIPVNDWIDYNGYFHSITNGELDRKFIAGLFDSAE